MERLEQFFEANDLTGDDKAAERRATFLVVIGPEPYELLRSLLAPTKPKEKTCAELVSKLTEHYSPTPSEVMQRFRFNWAIPVNENTPLWRSNIYTPHRTFNYSPPGTPKLTQIYYKDKF